MKKHIRKIIFIFLLSAFVLTACSSPAPNAAPEAPQMSKPEAAAYDTADIAEVAMEEPAAAMPQDASGGVPEEGQEKKEIKNATVEAETNDFDGYIATLRGLTEDCGGYIESYNAHIYETTQNKELKNGTIVLRIPFDQYEAVTAQLRETARVLNFSESSHLETAQYYDIDARMKAKLVQEEKLLEMLSKATAVEDLIALEQRLADVRESIELYEAQLRDIDNRADYSTVTVYVMEIAVETLRPVSDDFLSQIGESIVRSANFTVRFFEEVIIFLAAMIIPGILLGVPAGVIFLWQKRKKAKNKEG